MKVHKLVVNAIPTISSCWSAGQTKDAEDVSGTITVPEVAHDTEENEYVVRPLHPVL